MTIFITSDTHFGHARIIELCQRPFASVEEMDEVLIENWNKRVRPNDIVWHLGDFAYKAEASKYFSRLNGLKHLILGNHDDPMTGVELPWAAIEQYAWIEATAKTRLVMFHYPIAEWDGWYKGNIHAHGHQHNKIAFQANRRIDVGVDAHDFQPWALEELLEYASATSKE